MELQKKPEFKIGNRLVGENHAPFIIAEIGINHGGCLDVAKRFVDQIARAGADCVKHQTHFVDDEMTQEALNIFPPNDPRSIWQIMEEYALTEIQEIQLKEYAESLGLIYISTPFSRQAAIFLNEIGVPAFKIGSGECNHLPLLKLISRFGLPVIMSTGMQTIEAVKKSAHIFNIQNIPLALLECTNLYPSPPEIVSLKGISDLRQSFRQNVIGFSDHSIGNDMVLAALGKGASIIERHYTDSRYRKGPDIPCSMDFVELSHLVRASKEIHSALHVEKRRSEPEDAVYKFARGSIVADRDLVLGHVVTEDDIWARRPGTGEISVEDFYRVVGSSTTRKIVRNEQLSWSDLA